MKAYKTAARITVRALARFFVKYRVTVTVSGRVTEYPCRTLAECFNWLELNSGVMTGYAIRECGLFRHRVIFGGAE